MGVCVWRDEAAPVSLRGVSIVGPGVLNVVLIVVLSRLLLAMHESPVARAVLGLLLDVSVPCSSSSSLHSPYRPSVANYPSNSLLAFHCLLLFAVVWYTLRVTGRIPVTTVTFVFRGKLLLGCGRGGPGWEGTEPPFPGLDSTGHSTPRACT